MYTLSPLPYAYNALEPFIDEQTMHLHHDKHHAAYVNNANLLLEKIATLRKSPDMTGIRPLLLSLSFNVSGHFLHDLFWQVMGSPKKNNLPDGKIKEMIDKNFGSFDIFWKEFSTTAIQVEGSGWSTLVYDKQNTNLMVVPVEKHNLLGIQGTVPLLVLDVWEHAYYLKYQTDRAGYVNNFSNIVNWKMVEKRFIEVK
jgi:superoxide dismutase, Fe-Mn family